MQKQVNVRMLGWLAGVALVLGIGAYFLHAYQVRRNADAWLRLANRAEAQGDFHQSARLLKSYLTYVPGDIDAQVRYGSALERSATSRKVRLHALTVFEQIVTRAPGRADARRQAAAIALQLGFHPDARKHLDVLSGWEPNNGELELLLGRCEEADGDHARAQSSYRKAISDAPALLDGYLRLARLLSTQFGQPEEAGKVLDQMVAANPESLPAYLERARFLQAAGALEEAAGDIARAAGLAPNDTRVLQSAALLAHARGNIDEARRYLDRCQRIEPKNSSFFLSLADLELRAGRPGAALATLEQGLKVLPHQPELAQAEAEVLIRSGNLERSRRAIDRLEQSGMSLATVQYLKAMLLVAGDRCPEAEQALEGLLPALDNMPALARQTNLLLAECYQRGGKFEKQLDALRRAVDNDPTSLAAREGLASALLVQGKLDDALAEFRRMIVLGHASPYVWARFAQAVALRNLHLPPMRRDWREVDRMLERAEKPGTEVLEVALIRADIATLRGDRDRARAILIELRSRMSQEDDGLLRVAQAFVRLGEYLEAGHTCRLLTERRPDDLRSWLLSFDVALQWGADSELDRALAAIRRLEGEDGAAWHYCKAAQLVLKARRGNSTGLDEARDHLAKAGARKAAWARVHVLDGQLAELTRQTNAAIQHYLRAIELGENDPATLTHVLTLLHDLRRDAEASPLLDKLLARGSLVRQTARVGAVIALNLEQKERAVLLARRAVGLEAGNSRDALWLSSVLENAGQVRQAEEVLQDAAERWGTVPDTWIALVGFLVRQEQKTRADQAINQARDRLAPDRSDLALAQCLELVGRKAEAEEHYKSSVKSAADTFLATRKLAQFYLKNSNSAQAEPLLRYLADPTSRAPSDHVGWARGELDRARQK
jgi:tetratricopeptide (TPR) repeat protein